MMGMCVGKLIWDYEGFIKYIYIMCIIYYREGENYYYSVFIIIKRERREIIVY
jgi:hypothetical protein